MRKIGDFQVTYSEYSETTFQWWTGFKPWPEENFQYTKYLNMPHEYPVGMIVTEYEGDKYVPKRFEMEALVTVIAVKKGAVAALREEINKAVECRRMEGYVVSGFNVVPDMTTKEEDVHQRFFVIVQGTMRTIQPVKKNTDVVVTKEPKALKL